MSESHLERFAALVEERLKWDGLHSCHPECDRPACVHTRKAVEAEREACASIEVHLTTPVRDYTDMSPLDAYETALMDAAIAFREAIRARGCNTAERGQE